MADNGFVAGQSTDNAVDPLTGSPTSLAVLWRNNKIVNLGTLGGYESAAAAVNQVAISSKLLSLALAVRPRA